MSRTALRVLATGLLTMSLFPALSQAERVTVAKNISSEATLQLVQDTGSQISFEWTAGAYNVDPQQNGVRISVDGARTMVSEEGRPLAGGLVMLPWGHSVMLKLPAVSLLALANWMGFRKRSTLRMLR
jgi:hypothetical protein